MLGLLRAEDSLDGRCFRINESIDQIRFVCCAAVIVISLLATYIKDVCKHDTRLLPTRSFGEEYKH